VILGAGLCGLSAAYHLEQQGRADYLVLERGDEVGGLARTTTSDGFAFDHAIHVLYSSDPYATNLIRDTLLSGNVARQTRRSYCYSAGVYTEYPYQLNNRGLPAEVIVENILGLIEARANRPDEAAPHFEAWIHQTYGRGIATNFMVPYNRRQWAWNLEEMHYGWIADRIAVPELREVLWGALQPHAERFGPNREFWYPLEGGISALPRAFQDRLPSDRLMFNAGVSRVDSSQREVWLTNGQRVPYRTLISTIPLPALVAALGDDVPREIVASAEALESNVVHTVNVGLDGEDLGAGSPMHWVYFPEDRTVFHRVSYPGQFSPWMVPPGGSSIQMEISESRFRPCDRAALVDRCLRDLVDIGVLREGDARPISQGGRVRMTQMLTLDPAYVIYDLAHRENTETIAAYLQSVGIASRGRFGEWEYLNMDHAILSGKAAAEAIPG